YGAREVGAVTPPSPDRCRNSLLPSGFEYDGCRPVCRPSGSYNVRPSRPREILMPIAITARLLRNLVAVMALGALLSGCGVNNIPTYEEQAKAKWADVNNQYQRRADLIPNLVETVKGYAKQERETLEAVVNARAKATSIQVTPDIVNDPAKFKQFQDAQSQLSGALGRLIAVSESYPDLKSNQNFLALQSQLEGTENRIAVARRDYIEAVRVYNTELRTFPGVLWASTVYRSHKPMETFTVAEDVRRPPAVKF